MSQSANGFEVNRSAARLDRVGMFLCCRKRYDFVTFRMDGVDRDLPLGRTGNWRRNGDCARKQVLVFDGNVPSTLIAHTESHYVDLFGIDVVGVHGTLN